ncbi:MAG: leucine-rich repeat domain-containing protein [Bacteroidota bacterium]
MKYCLPYVIAWIFAISCDFHANEKGIGVTGVTPNKISYDTNLTTTPEDTFFIKSINRSMAGFYNTTDAFCKKVGDTIFVRFKKGNLSSHYTQITIINDDVSVISEIETCGPGSRFHPIETSLTLNKRYYNVDDSIIGHLSYSGSSYSSSITISGKFKLKVMNAAYDFDKLRNDNNYNSKFLQIFKSNPEKTKFLDLSDCGLTSIPKELIYFENLEELDLSRNNFENADLGLLASFRKLKSISFQNCQLKTFPEVVLSLRELEILNVFGNKIKQLPEGLYELNRLSELGVGENELTFLSPRISKLTRLKSLSFSGTRISTLPATIVKLKSLNEIYPSYVMDSFPRQLVSYLHDVYRQRIANSSFVIYNFYYSGGFPVPRNGELVIIDSTAWFTKSNLKELPCEYFAAKPTHAHFKMIKVNYEEPGIKRDTLLRSLNQFNREIYTIGVSVSTFSQPYDAANGTIYMEYEFDGMKETSDSLTFFKATKAFGGEKHLPSISFTKGNIRVIDSAKSNINYIEIKKLIIKESDIYNSINPLEVVSGQPIIREVEYRFYPRRITKTTALSDYGIFKRVVR